MLQVWEFLVEVLLEVLVVVLGEDEKGVWGFLVEVQLEVLVVALVVALGEDKRWVQEEVEILADQCMSSKKLPVLI